MEKTYEKKSGGGDRGGDRGDRGERGEGDEKRRGFTRRKVCRFCADTKIIVDFKDQSTLKYFVTERGKIIPRRISGNCSLHQRAIARAIKQSRGLALIPYLVVAG